jgi:AcrR family transcriptional regulator
MPYPSQVNIETIIQTAWEMVEAEGGIQQVSLKKLAAALGIKAPSLYRYIQNKAALLKAVNQMTEQRLFAAIGAAMRDNQGQPAHSQLLIIANTYRTFAHANPTTYTLAFTTVDAHNRPDPDEQERDVLPFQALIAQLTGEAQSLPALRGFLALVHGFIMLELHEQLRRGGDLGAAFVQSVEAYLRGWTSS